MLIKDAFPTELLRNYTKWPKVPVERIQTGVRMEKRMLKVLKGMAEYNDMTLGELLGDIVLHVFNGVSKVITAKRILGKDRGTQEGLSHGPRRTRCLQVPRSQVRRFGRWSLSHVSRAVSMECPGRLMKMGECREAEPLCRPFLGRKGDGRCG